MTLPFVSQTCDVEEREDRYDHDDDKDEDYEPPAQGTSVCVPIACD